MGGYMLNNKTEAEIVIDFSKANTYPVEIKELINASFGELSDENRRCIISKSVRYPADVGAAIEKYYSSFRQDELYKSCKKILMNYSVVAFHATRILTPQSIIEHGLKTNNPDNYQEFLGNALNAIGLSGKEKGKILSLVEHEYLRKTSSSNASTLCFFASLEQMDGGDIAGYDQFCQNVGGELARWALQSKYPQILQALKTIGLPVVVEFLLPFSDIPRYEMDTVVYKFIQYYAAKHFWQYHYPIEFDSHILFDIPPEQIIQIHPYTKKLDYE